MELLNARQATEMWTRRPFTLGIVSASALATARLVSAENEPSVSLLGIDERAMRLAIDIGRGGRTAPFGAVIVQRASGSVSARGVNDSRANPTLHAEIAAMNDYVARHGNQGWGEQVLYVTAEPCPMCMSALVWAGIGGVVYGTSLERLRELGFKQIEIDAATVIRAAPFYRGSLRGGVLAAETDVLFANRRRS